LKITLVHSLRVLIYKRGANFRVESRGFKGEKKGRNEGNTLS